MGAIGLRGLRGTVRFLHWALPVQRVNIRGYAPDTPEGRTYANTVCVRLPPIAATPLAGAGHASMLRVHHLRQSLLLQRRAALHAHRCL